MRSAALLSGLVMLLAAKAMPAQAATAGVLLGLNRASISGDAPPKTEYSTRVGLAAGAQVEICLARGVFLSLQPMYVQRGAGVTVADSTTESRRREEDLALDYVALPLVVRFAAMNGRTFVTGGIDTSFLSRARLINGDQVTDLKSG